MTHQQRWHSEALQMFGEKVIVRRRWGINDFAAGRVGRCSTCQATNRVNEQQKVIVDSGILSGNFTLTLLGNTTEPIAHDATPNDLLDALLALDGVEATDIAITGNSLDRGVLVEFMGSLAGRSIDLMTVTSTFNPSSRGVRIVRAQKGSEDIRSRVTAVYKQAGESWCSNCFGIGFEGGFEPTIYVTWALITDQEQETTHTPTGTIQRETPTAQFSFEPEITEFDLVVRVVRWAKDGVTPLVLHNRSVLRKVIPVTLRSGPGTPEQSEVVYQEPWKYPEDRDKFNLEDQRWVVGQTGQLVNLPLEHPWNSVGITVNDERVVKMGETEHRAWLRKMESSLNSTPEVNK